MNRSMSKRAMMQKRANTLRELQGMAGQAAVMQDPRAVKASENENAQQAVFFNGGLIYAPMAASIILSQGEDEDFPADELAAAADLARKSAAVYCVTSGMKVPGMRMVRMDSDGNPVNEEGSDDTDENRDAPEEKSQSPIILG